MILFTSPQQFGNSSRFAIGRNSLYSAPHEQRYLYIGICSLAFDAPAQSNYVWIIVPHI